MCDQIAEKSKKLVIALKLQRKKIAFAESVSGGMFAKAITDTAGSSNVLECAIVAYSERIKEKVLRVNAETIKRCGVVSEAVAAEMAIGVQNISGASLAISCTGEAGPVSSGAAEVGTVCVGVFYMGLVKTYTLKLDSDLQRNEIRTKLTEKMLDIALETIKAV